MDIDDNYSHIVLDASKGERFGTNNPELYTGKEGCCIHTRDEWRRIRNPVESVLDRIDRIYEGGLMQFSVDQGADNELAKILHELCLSRKI